MTARLASFLAAALARPFARGRHDCCTFVADWAHETTGRDPAAHLRGTYHDDAGALALIAAAGGTAAIVGGALERQGWQRVAEPSAGDIAVVAVPTPAGTEDVAAVCTRAAENGRRARFALVTARGLVVAPAACSAAWRHMRDVKHG